MGIASLIPTVSLADSGNEWYDVSTLKPLLFSLSGLSMVLRGSSDHGARVVNDCNIWVLETRQTLLMESVSIQVSRPDHGGEGELSAG